MTKSQNFAGAMFSFPGISLCQADVYHAAIIHLVGLRERSVFPDFHIHHQVGKDHKMFWENQYVQSELNFYRAVYRRNSLSLNGGIITLENIKTYNLNHKKLFFYCTERILEKIRVCNRQRHCTDMFLLLQQCNFQNPQS